MNELFKNVPPAEIEAFLKNVKAKYVNYKKDNFVFFEGDKPEYVFVLIYGAVQVEKNDAGGKRIIINRFEEPDTVFGEVYAFIEPGIYDYSCRVIKDSRVLCIPCSAVSSSSSRNEIQITVMQNLLTVLAHKAYFLNQKLLIFSSFNLRQRIAVYLLQQSSAGRDLKLNREALAEYLGVPRPSLSRELMNMQNDGILTVHKDMIIADPDKLEDLR